VLEAPADEAAPTDMTLEALCAPRSDVLVYDTFNAAAACAASAGSFVFGNAPAAGPMAAPAAQAPGAEGESRVQQRGRRKRRRRQRSVRNAEDAENQRRTHIAVERNRRRQMNEYLAVLRSLMPESYVHRVRSTAHTRTSITSMCFRRLEFQWDLNLSFFFA
jgi:hypothetical protein